MEFKVKTAYEMRISDWSSDVCSSDLHQFGENAQQLVAPDYPPLAVHHADPVPVSVESHSEIELLGADKRFQVLQIRLDSGIGVMMGKMSVYLGEKHMMLTWQELDQLVHHRPGGAVARVPANAPGGAVEPLHQPGDVAVHDGDKIGRAHV